MIGSRIKLAMFKAGVIVMLVLIGIFDLWRNKNPDSLFQAVNLSG